MNNLKLIFASIVGLCTVSCVHGDYTPYYIVECSEVLEYTPAPGQFIGEECDATTMDKACEYASERVRDGKYVSLGAFGGYLIAKMERQVGWDCYVAVVGNSTNSSSEPGIVSVMEDENGNGLPDDHWIEIKGSLYETEEEIRNYSVTYFRPEIEADIRWTDNLGNEGYIRRNEYHAEASYYPTWVKEDSYTLSGPRLKSRAYDQSGNGTMWINPTYGEGYADNYANEFPDLRKNVNKFFGKPAITQNANILFVGRPFDFVKVQTAVMDQCGWIGEISTEVCGVFAIECHYVE